MYHLSLLILFIVVLCCLHIFINKNMIDNFGILISQFCLSTQGRLSSFSLFARRLEKR